MSLIFSKKQYPRLKACAKMSSLIPKIAKNGQNWYFKPGFQGNQITATQNFDANGKNLIRILLLKDFL